MHPLQKAAVFIILLATLIFVHELGHFLIAKLFRVKVLKFSLGFGPRLFGFRWGETEYRVSVLPLGGYVKMAGDDPTEEVAPEDRGRGFLDQAPWKRAAIAFAGPAMSLLFPIAVYFVAFYFKDVDLSSRLGRVEPDRPAYAAGLRAGDRIVAVDGEPVAYFNDLREMISPKWDRPVQVTYERAGMRQTVSVVPERIEERSLLETEVRGVIGVSPIASAAVIAVPDPSSPAAKAGLATFDRVARVGGVKVDTFAQLEDQLRQHAGPVTLTVVRDEPQGGAAGALTTYRTFEATLDPGRRDGAPWSGIEDTDLYVFSVVDGSPAQAAGMRRGDKLLELNGTALGGWSTYERIRDQNADRPLRVAFLQDGQRVEREIQQRRDVEVDAFDNKTPIVLFGVQRDLRASSYVEGEKIPVQIPVSTALVRAITVVPNEVRKIGMALGLLATGEISVKNIGGPIMMYQAAVKSAELGWEYFLQMMGFISVNLGLMNLLPIPVLDGFHILSAGVETVRRRPLGMRARMVATYIGLVVLFSLMVLALRNDLVNFVLN